MHSPWIFRMLLLPVWVVVLASIYWLIDYQEWNPLGGPPLKISGEVLTPEVRPGGTLIVNYEWEVLRDCPRRVELWINNGQPHLISSHYGSTSGRGPGRQSKLYSFTVPETVEDGPAILRSISVWSCNPLRSMLHAFDLPFTVAGESE